MWNTALCWKILLVGVKYSSLLETLLGATHHLVCEKHCTCAAWVAAAERQHKSSSTPELGIGGMLCWIKSLKKGLRKENINWKSAQDSKSSFLSSQKVLKNRIGLSSRNWKWGRGRAAHSSALSSPLNLCFQFLPKKIIAIVIWFEKVLVYLFSPALALSSCTKGNHENWLRMNEINWITIIWLCCEIPPGRLHSNCVSACWQLFALVTQQSPSYYEHHSNLIMSSCCLWSFDSE